MPFLVVAGVTVPVTPGGFEEEEPLEVGETVTAFDGSDLSSVRSRKRRWRVTTRLLTGSEFESVRGALEGTPPLTCSGDALGASFSCRAKISRVTTQRVENGLRRVIEFALIQR